MATVEEIEQEISIDSRTEEGHTQSTFFGEYRGKKAVIKRSKDEDVKREKEALELVEETDFGTPEILGYAENGEQSVLVTERIDSAFPSRKDWESLDFCMDLASSAAEVFNQMHSNSLDRKAKKKDYCSGNRKRALNAMERKNYKIDEEVGGRIAEICRRITEEIDLEHRFTHGDFSTENILISNGEIEAVIDWADCGCTSRLRDIALFEASFIDEYVRFFHPEKYRAVRRNFRNRLDRELGEKLELYRFHQNAVILAYIKRGNCSEEWLKTGTEKEITEHRKKVLKEDRRKAEEIVRSRY